MKVFWINEGDNEAPNIWAWCGCGHLLCSDREYKLYIKDNIHNYGFCSSCGAKLKWEEKLNDH